MQRQPAGVRRAAAMYDPGPGRAAGRAVCPAAPVPQAVRGSPAPGGPPAGQGRRRPGREPDHPCDERCVPTGARPARRRRSTRCTRSCTGRSRSRSSGGGWTAAPADLVTRPRAARDDRDLPTPRDAARLLEAAGAYRPGLALWLWLLLVTRDAARGAVRDPVGRRRLRREGPADRARLRRPRRPGGHRAGQAAPAPPARPGPRDRRPSLRVPRACAKRADPVGGVLAADGYAFSSDGSGAQPWPPDTVAPWFRRVRVAAGVDCTLRSLRHCTATQMLAAGIDVRSAAGRLGRAAGGSVTLKVYAHRTRLAGQRAAKLPARELRARVSVI